MTVKAIYNHGVFRPVEPVDLPENVEVEVVLPGERAAGAESTASEQARADIMEILSRRYKTGQTDTAERHNEHQP